MDNLTHSLVGALIGQMGLKRKTGLAMPTLIIAANIPDIDAVATLLGGNAHLAIRRGITHGPIAMVVLPVLLWGIMLWFDRWQTRRGKRPDARLPMHSGWLLGLAYIGCLSHPLFDWFNSYGIRLLEPFSSQWFYGDTLFIIDLWLWIALVAGVWMSRRREKTGTPNPRTPALASCLAICAYLLTNGLITGRAEYLTAQAVGHQHGVTPSLVVANPVPVAFWRREMLWRDQTRYGSGAFVLPGTVTLDAMKDDHGMNDTQRLGVLRDDADARAFLFWSRMPFITSVDSKDGETVALSDQRFNNPLTRDRFTLTVPLKESEK